MHILILGGSGTTGRIVITEVLSRNHTLTALLRTPSAIPSLPGLTTTPGTPLSRPDLLAAFAAHPVDAVIIALASQRASRSPFSASTSSPTLMLDAHTAFVAVIAELELEGKMKKRPRVVTMQAFGVGSSKVWLWAPMRMVMEWSPMRVGNRDHEAVEGFMRAQKEVEWIGVRACMLVEGEKREVKVWGKTGKGSGWVPRVTRRSVAGFLVDCVEDEGREWVGKTPVVSN